MRVTNWGRYPVIDVPMHEWLRDEARDRAALDSVPSYIPRAMGRCYGDSALGESIASLAAFNRCLAFDEVSGILHCESGFTFADMLAQFVPRGWFPPVTPGTKFVSVGGAIASDVHGKNHHKVGCFSEHVLDFELRTPQGSTIRCTRDDNADVFWATIGGMGLTGIILSVRLRLKPIANAHVTQRAIKTRTLDELLALFATHTGSTYSVAWIDTLQIGRHAGRSILLLGEHAEPMPTSRTERNANATSLSVPFDLPSFTLNRFTIGAFNWAFYHKQLRRDVEQSMHYEPYFYPLDNFHNWNRIYGRRGFTQYQFAVPFAMGREVIHAVLTSCRRAGFSSFLSVLKAFGPRNPGLLSFPIEGLTLTMDFPIRPALFPLLDRLDAIVAEHGGRVYLTKDVRLGRAMFDRMYPQANEFRSIRERLDPQRRIQSLQSRRLGI